MTVPEILKALRPTKRVSRDRLYVYIRRFKIKPLGRRIRPQHYPDNTPQRILSGLGLANGHTNGKGKR